MLPRLVSLYVMLRFLPYRFLVVAEARGLTFATATFLRSRREDDPMAMAIREATHFTPDENTAAYFLDIERQCDALGLDAAATSARRLHDAHLNGCDNPTMHDLLKEFTGRMEDQLFSRMCWMIEPDKTRFFDEPNLFDTQDVKVSDRFPSAIVDIEEAGKCLALDRNTACVFHLMRVMEAGLRALGASLNDPTLDPQTNPSWDRILSRGDKELAKRAVDRSPEWKAKPDFFAGAHATLRSVSVAWRNPTMHIEKTYDGEKALDVLNAVKGFMRHLATELRETP